MCTTTPVYSVGIIVVVSALAIPIAVQLTQMNTSIDSMQVFPRDAPSLLTWKQLTAAFPMGLVEPLFLVIPAPLGVLDAGYFNASNGLIAALVEDGLIATSGTCSTLLDLTLRKILSRRCRPHLPRRRVADGGYLHHNPG
jgi:hypothetical protein